ncbi:MAG: acetate/propionate family kinase [Candidatus Woesearchaeota archaeon]
MKILVLNLGSSSLKCQLFEAEEEKSLFTAHIEGIGSERSAQHYYFEEGEDNDEKQIRTHKEGIKICLKTLISKGIIETWKDIDAIGHRIVHGGDYFKEAALINTSTISYIKIFSDLAPLHNPIQLNGINACKSYMPDIRQVAVFDTAFHNTMPEKAHMYALPLDLYKKHKLRKYGFHGSSHKYVAGEAMKHIRKKSPKIITCHLGNGSSITAIDNGESVDTSMGFTPLDGLPMGTRAGSIDPSVPLYMIKKLKMSPDEVEEILNKKSGFLGLTQMVSDLRDVYGLSEKNNPKAVVALDMFVHKIISFIGSYSVGMGGVDAIVFTGGIGENADYIRSRVCDRLGLLGVKIDKKKNRSNAYEIQSSSSKVRVMIIPTDEELQIARETYEKVKTFIK